MTLTTSKMMRGSGPLYKRVKAFVLQQILEGQWSIGDRIPSEQELVEILGVSRLTIHRALRELQTEQVLIRTPRTGTFVADPKPQAALLAIRNISQEISEQGRRHSSRVITLEALAAGKELVRELGVKLGAEVYHSVVIHFSEDVAVQCEERFIRPNIAPEFLQQDFERTTTYEYLNARSPMTEAEQILDAILPDIRIQTLMQIDAMSPCLRLKRRTWNGATVTSFSLFIYPSSRYRLGGRYKLKADGSMIE